MDKTDKMRKKRNWKLVLFAGLVLEVLFIFGVIYGGIHGGGTPLWQLLVCVGIAVWIYIAFLKQRSIDISKSVVEEKVKTHTLADYLREGILLIDANDCVLLINRGGGCSAGCQRTGCAWKETDGCAGRRCRRIFPDGTERRSENPGQRSLTVPFISA